MDHLSVKQVLISKATHNKCKCIIVAQKVTQNEITVPKDGAQKLKSWKKSVEKRYGDVKVNEL